MSKRIFSALLALVLILACLPQVALAEDEALAGTPVPLAEPAPHSHSGSHLCQDCQDSSVTWTAWTKTNEVPTATGHYYLTGNVTVSKRWLVGGSSNVVLCLNGYTVKSTGTSGIYEPQSTAKLTITDCTGYTGADGKYVSGALADSSAKDIGAFLYATGQGQLKLYGITLRNGKNTQDSTSMGYSGGAIQLRGNSYLYMKDCYVVGNTTSAEGGAICLRETNATGSTAASALLENVVFESNKADRKGGVIFLNSAKNSIQLKDCTFTGNTCPGSGGVIFSNYGTVEVENCTFTGNSCGNGGGIFNMCGGKLTIKGGTFTGKSGADSAKNGGLLYMNKSCQTTITGGSFTGFQTSNLGGIAYASESGSLLLIEGGTFSGNKSRNGGAFAIESKGTFKITSGTVENNTATNKAGALYINGEGTTSYFAGGKFQNNTAPNGGGIYMETKTSLTIRTGRIINNTATGKGGGIYANASTTINITGDPEIRGNQVGGANNNIYLPEGQVLSVSAMSQGSAMVGITANTTSLPYAFTGDLGSANPSGYFFSDDATRMVTTLNNTLVLVAATNHSHCACANQGGEHCQHEKAKWTPWVDGTKLPSAPGYYYLETDVKTAGRTTITGTDQVYLCLNGHKIDGNKNLIFEVNTDGKLTITDCGTTGSLENGRNTNVSGAVYLQGNGQLEMFGGTLRNNENTQTSESLGWSGGAIHVRGDAKALFVGVVFENNTSSAEGGAICLRGNAQVTLEKATFRGNTGRNAGAIYLSERGCTVKATDCSFDSNQATVNAGGAISGTGTLELTGCRFTDNAAKNNGGAIMRNSGAMTLRDCVFTGNAGSNGGAIRITDKGTATITDSQFSGNTATANGGAISTLDSDVTISGSSFEQHTAAKAGGAIYFQGNGNTLTLENTDFIENTAVASGGGAIQVVTNAQLVVKGGTFRNNSCTDNNGGAVYISNNCSMVMDGGTISGNTCKSLGAGIYLLGATLTVHDGQFNGNTAINGAAIAARAGVRTVDGQEIRDIRSTVTIHNATISGNVADQGGALYAETDAVIELNGGTISGNTANVQGGGIYVGYQASLVMTGGTIENNTTKSKRGGGICMMGGTVTLSGGQILKNHAAEYGGAIGGSTVTRSGVTYRNTLTIHDSLIQGNTAAQGGGGFGLSGVDFLMTGGKITGNSTPKSAGGMSLMSGSTMKLTGGEITKNTAGITCGGVYINGTSKFTMEGGSISNNTSRNNGAGMYLEQSTAEFAGGTISYNTSQQGTGGGMYMSGCTANFRGTSVVGNYAKTNGGGIVVQRYKNSKKGLDIRPVTNIYGGTIRDNFAEGPAGGMLLMSDGVTTFAGGTLTANESKGNGGGIYVSTGHTFKMSGGIITGNKSGSQGAGVYHLASKGIYTGGSIEKNVAFKNGGGMVFTGASEISMKDFKILENQAWLAGAFIINNSQVKLTAEDCQFNRNQAVESHAGAIYCVWGVTDAQITRCQIQDNTAKQQGGAIATANGLYITFTDCVITGNYAGTEGGAVYTKAPLTFDGCVIANNTTDGNGGAFITDIMGTSSVLHPVLVIKNCTVENNQAEGSGGALYLRSGTCAEMADSTLTGNVAKLEGSAIWAHDDLTLSNMTITGNTSKSGAYAVYLGDAEYDGFSYYRGFYKIDGQMIIADNDGGDMYMGNQVAISVGNQGLIGQTHMEIDLYGGQLTQLLYGVYNYEREDLHYTVTAGDRSLTDPEPVPMSQQETETQEAANTGDILLYAGIGVVAAAAVAAILLFLKKKKPAAGATK